MKTPAKKEKAWNSLPIVIGTAEAEPIGIDCPGQAELRLVTRIIGLGTVASGLSAAAGAGVNRAGPQIAQVADLA